MDQKSQLKVIKAGFVIIRIDDQPAPRIKAKSRGHLEWYTFKKDFKSKAERDRMFNQLLVSNIMISD
jgi:hypothetical protein